MSMKLGRYNMPPPPCKWWQSRLLLGFLC